MAFVTSIKIGASNGANLGMLSQCISFKITLPIYCFQDVPFYLIIRGFNLALLSRL